MIVLVLVDCIKPWPEVQCHGQETIRCCGDSGDSHLGVASCMSSSETDVKRSAFALAGLMTCSAQGSCGSHDAGGWNPLQNCQFCVLFLSFLLWMGISLWQVILCPNCPKVTPSWEISRAVLVGAEPRVKACILISCGLSLLMKWMVVVVGHLTLAVFAVFVSERRQKAQLQQRSWKLQVWAWLENAKLPSVVRLCGDFFCRLFD